MCPIIYYIIIESKKKLTWIFEKLDHVSVIVAWRTWYGEIFKIFEIVRRTCDRKPEKYKKNLKTKKKQQSTSDKFKPVTPGSFGAWNTNGNATRDAETQRRACDVGDGMARHAKGS